MSNEARISRLEIEAQRELDLAKEKRIAREFGDALRAATKAARCFDEILTEVHREPAQ